MRRRTVCIVAMCLGRVSSYTLDTPSQQVRPILLLVVALTLPWRVDVNEFSIHYLYRNRLVLFGERLSFPQGLAESRSRIA
jgi:hypothetical protein